MILIEWTQLPFQSVYGRTLHSAYCLNEYIILINGKGQSIDQSNHKVPLEVFHVKRGFRYRFRLIRREIWFCDKCK